jgi:hypothetical protein
MSIQDAIKQAPVLATLSLTGAQWSKIDQLEEIQKILKARLDPPTFELVCDMQALSLDILVEEYDNRPKV